MTALVWFRNDLRVSDNAALAAASKSGRPVLAVYILNDAHAWPLGRAARVWLHESLQSLSESLLNLGVTLLLKRGRPVDVIRTLIEEHDICEVHWNREYTPDGIADARAVKVELGQRLQTKSHGGRLLAEPHQFLNKSGEPYRVFTPFWKALRQQLGQPEVHSIEPGWRQTNPVNSSPSINALGVLTGLPWERELRENWQIGERGANEMLGQFTHGDVVEYENKRDYPALSATSSLSPYLAFGELSPRRVWVELTQRLDAFEFPNQENSVWAWLRQLVWREFSHHLLFHFPKTTDQPLNARFEKMQWLENDELFVRWQQGTTGYPLVDAGMRQLWQTGWMHNRVRMLVASFLTKHLGIHWLRGAKWFWDTLVDADLANNTMGWQWVAGCGADAAPYYRIFNPTLQSQKFDVDGRYIRHWVEELRTVDIKEIHTPMKAVQEGRVSYPTECVAHQQARLAALARYEEIRS